MPDARAAVHADEDVLERVIVGNRRMFWNVRPMPSSVISCGGKPAKSWPSKMISPEVGV